MAEERRFTLYLRQHSEEQALYRYLMRRNKRQRMALIRNMILTEFRRRRTKGAAPARKNPSTRSPRARVLPVKEARPAPTDTQSPWMQRVTL
ncbi:MAG: hypothetical protein OEV08_16220 [Nitrospira sp.]|nr:hypothetical protein [Nitrospira sp.]